MLLLPGINGFPFPSPEAEYSDMAVSHYPNALFLVRSITTGGSIPLWSPTILSGYPFFANPLSGLWYFPGWFALIFPLPLGFNITIILHMLWGAAGMYLLLRTMRVDHPAALFGALAFESMPKMFAHLGAGHLTLMYAIPWTPWLIWAAYQRKYKQERPAYLYPSIVMAIIFLADVRWCVYAAILWVTWEFAYAKHGWWNTLGRILPRIFIATMLAAPLAIPLLEYTALSSRIHMAVEDVLIFSLPPERLLGILFPDFGGLHEWMVYLGGVVIVFALLGITWPASRKQSNYWVGVLVLSIVFSLGSYLPGMKMVAELPGVSLLRVPSRTLFLTGIAASILAALALNHMLTGIRTGEATRARLMLTALTGFSVVIAIAVGWFTDSFPLNMIWGTAVTVGVFTLLMMFFAGRVAIKSWIFLIFLLAIIDLSVINTSLFSMRPASEVLDDGSEAAEYLSTFKERVRVYSPSYSIPQQTASYYGVELVDGVDPLHLEKYANFMEMASGVPRQGYSVTIPSYSEDEADIHTANAVYTPTEDLGRINVGFVISEFDLDIEYKKLTRFGSTRLYEIPNEFGYTYIQGETNKLAELVSWSPNKISLSVEGPGTLILSEIPYPGWLAFVDGEPREIIDVYGVNRAVELHDGPHSVEFVFRPMTLYIGWGLSFLSVNGLIIYARRSKKNTSIE